MGIPGTAGHTRGDNNPDEVHQKVIQPKIIRLRSGIWPAVDIVVKQTGRIIQGVAVQMAHAHNDLDRVAQGMPGCGQVCNNEAQWPPQELSRKSGISGESSRVHYSTIEWWWDSPRSLSPYIIPTCPRSYTGNPTEHILSIVAQKDLGQKPYGYGGP